MSEMFREQDVQNVHNLIKNVVDEVGNTKDYNKTRVIIMGATGAGKSSLVNALSSKKKKTND